MGFLSLASISLGNNFLNMYHGIMLPSLPMSILYGTVILLSPAHISNLAVSIDRFLFIYTEIIILIVSISPLLYSWDISCSISFTTLIVLLWQTFLKCPTLLYPTHVLPYAGHYLSWCTPPQYLHGCCCMVQLTGALALPSFVFLYICTLSNCLDLVRVFSTTAWALYTSTFLAHTSIPPLVMWSSFLVAISSFIISSNMYFSFRLWMKCSLSCLPTSW